MGILERLPHERPHRSVLPAAQVMAAVVVAGALFVRARDVLDGQFPIGNGWLPLLTATAAILTSVVLRRRAPAVAWLATVPAAAFAAIEIVGVVRDRQFVPHLAEWPYEAALASAAIVIATGVAAAYAIRRGGDSRPLALWQLLVLAGLAVVGISAFAAVAGALNALHAPANPDVSPIDLGPLRVAGRIAAACIGIATLVGAWLDLIDPLRRAWAHADGLAALPRNLADELLPTSAAMRKRGVEDERARLAAELHARILPDLRRAAEAAEATGTAADPLAVGLRHAVEDVEELMHARQSVVLEEYGLVAALEWLAERTQQRSRLLVDVELEGDAVDSPIAVPKPVARAAFRVALLAMDNVVRHAAATHANVRLTVDERRLELAITDDGTGIGVAPQRRAGRGIVDMRAAAAEVGATLSAERAEPGTRVALVWEGGAAPPAAAGAGDHPSGAEQPADRRTEPRA